MVFTICGKMREANDPSRDAVTIGNGFMHRVHRTDG